MLSNKSTKNGDTVLKPSMYIAYVRFAITYVKQYKKEL
jgi:O-glycosyl hydrolase